MLQQLEFGLNIKLSCLNVVKGYQELGIIFIFRGKLHIIHIIIAYFNGDGS